MKILQFGRHFPPHTGGTENVMFDLTEGANNSGYQCDVLCCNDTNLFSIEVYGRSKVQRTKTLFKTNSTAISPQQITVLRKIWSEYDIIHVHHPAPMAALSLFLVRPKNKIVLTWHSDIIKQKVLLKFYKPLQNWLLKRADVICATTPTYIEGSESLKMYPYKTSWVSLGIAKPAVENRKIVDIRALYKNKRIIFSLGRLVEYKGYSYLIDAARFLDDSYVIVIGGDGHLRNYLKEEIDKKKLEDRVKLVGRIDDNQLASYFNFCDLFCLPSISKNEAFGLVIVEAMSYAKPIIATKIPGSGVSWVNEDGVSGINVEIESSLDLANAIKKISQDSALAKKLGDGAFERYNSRFKKEKMVEAYLSIYSKLMSN